MPNIFENSRMQLRQVRVNKSAIFVGFFMIWTMMISGIGKMDYAVNNSEMSVCLRRFEKEWRNGPDEFVDIPNDVPETAPDLRKLAKSSKDSTEIPDCSDSDNVNIKDNNVKITNIEKKNSSGNHISKDTTEDKRIKNTKDKSSGQKENKLQNHGKENNNKKNDLAKISLNARTEKSLKSKVTTRLTNILHSTMKKAYLLENPKLCSSVNDLKVLIIVHSATKNFDKRILIRETWTNNTYYPNLGPVRTLFLLGRAPNADVKAKINQEFKKYGDILQGDFIDSYHNLTLKGVMSFRWVTEKCRNAKVILKVDDDVIINMFYFLTETVPFIVSKPKHIACRRSGIARVKRNPNNKWFVQDELFRGENLFPEYCEGFTVVFSNDILPSLYKSAMLTPFFWIDDVYLYGLVPRNIPNVHYTNLIFNKHVIWGIDKIRACLTKETKCTHFVFLFLKEASLKMKKIWSLILKQEVKQK